MITICNGIVRSGATWSYNVCRMLNGADSGHGYLDAAQLDEFLNSRAAQLQTPLVIKAHHAGPVALEWIRARRAAAVCTLRDPRDCVASDMAFMNCPMEQSVKRVKESLEGASVFQDFGVTLFVRYEEMMADRKLQIARIAIHLGIDVNPQRVAEIDAATNFDSSRKICEELKSRNDENVLQYQGHRVDRATQLRDNHIISGKIGRWKEELSIEQGKELTKLFEPWLIKLGYETEKSIRTLYPPVVSKRKKSISSMMGRKI